MISIDRNLDILIEECQKLNLNPIPTKKNKKGIPLSVYDIKTQDPKTNESYYLTVSKEDVVRALQAYYVNIYKNENRYTHALDWVLKTKFQPMLAAQLKNCKWKEDIYNRDDEVIAETKIDGNRSIWCLFDRSEGVQIFSRNLSVQDYLPLCYTDKVVLNNIDMSKITHTFVIDGEIVASKIPDNTTLLEYDLAPDITQLNLTSTLLASDKDITKTFQKLFPLKLMVFDVIMFDGKDLTNEPLSERLKYREIIYKEMTDANFMIEKPWNNIDLGLTVEEFHKMMLLNDEEGSIVKLLDSKYCTNGSRPSDWIKLKRTVGSMDDTIDGFITGFHNVVGTDNNTWRVSTVEFSIYMIKDADEGFDDSNNYDIDMSLPVEERVVKVIANVSGLTEEDARELSEPDPNNPGFCRLKKEAYGRVAELNGQDISPRSMTLTHPRIIRWRYDKPMDQCDYRETFLKKSISKRSQDISR